MLAPMASAQLIAQLAASAPDHPVRLGRYDVTGLIGAGGMGTVYDAIDLEHGTRVALKTLTSWDPANLLRFKNEFRSVAHLSHPNLVSLYELNLYEDLWFFTMDHIEGVDFIEWLRGTPTTVPPLHLDTVVGSPLAARNARNAAVDGDDSRPRLPPSLPRVRDALAQLIAGVHALHEAGFLHLDIKPSNVLVDQSGQVFVLDFGLVRRVDEPRERIASDDDSISISGTPMWMAPEQFTGAAISEAVDWYAVGLMLYWGLTGVPAYPPAASASETAAARLRAAPIAAMDRVAGVPADLSELAGALLHAEAEQRPSGRTLLELTAGADALATRQQASFVGRHAELDVLRAAHAQVQAGDARVVHVSGSSGLGKTALLRRFLHEVRTESDTLALSGRCYERETVPYKAFDGLLDELAAALSTSALSPRLPGRVQELVQVFPALAGVPQIAAKRDTMSTLEMVGVVEQRRRAVEALCELLDNLAALRPLVLQIDDLQWADADSMALLQRILGGSPLARVMVVLSFRPDEAQASTVVSPYLAGSKRLSDRLVSIELGPLASQDAQTLASRQLDALSVSSPGLAETIAQESGGVPFFVEELAHYLTQTHHSADAMSADLSLDHVLAQRVKSLPEHQRALVEVLSVANSPIPLHIAFEEAGMASGALRSLWALRGRHLIRTTGAGADDLVELHHDRMRESVLQYLSAERTDEIHLGLARAFAEEGEASATNVWIFDAVRHFNSVHTELTGTERVQTARLNLQAARKARHAGAFPLAFDCFRAGANLLGADAWTDEYELAIALHSGAAETAHFSAAWDQLDVYIDTVKTHGRTIFDQLVGWEVHIDACIARREYAGAIDVAIQALQLLDTELPANPGDEEVGAAVQQAMHSLASVSPEALKQLANADDARVVAGMRIMSSISSAAYFACPPLLVVLACRQVVASVEHGLSQVTAYALSVYGIVLNSLGLHGQAHTWGQVALELLDRFDDLRVAARTRHVIHNLVCVWTVPLSTTLPKSREVVDACRAIGDVEYAGYATHGHVHNAIYAGWELQPLYEDAVALGDFMRGHEQVNALHVHEPFEQLLRCYLGLTEDPACLDGNGFSEQAALAMATEIGSSAGVAAITMVMGIARYTFGDVAEAHRCFATVRQMLAALPSIWHVPITHQYAALSIYGLPSAEREALDADADASIAALRHLSEHGPENFGHRVALVEAERARSRGELAAALDGFERCISLAEAGGWVCELALAHELAAKCTEGAARGAHAEAARAAWKRWGAVAKLA